MQAGDSEHGTCTIDMQHDTVTCTHNGTQWTCRDKGDQTWSCVSSFAAWTTDCPSCTGSSRSDYIYRFVARSWTQGEGFARRAAARRIMEVSMTMSDGSERCAFTGFRPVTATIAVITAFRIKD